jgi:Xaa-Pro aminopeptidase
MNDTSWMQDPSLAGIDPAKLQMLSALAEQAQGKNQNELLPFLMTLAAQAQTGEMSFGQNEIDAIINVMKAGKSPQEIARIDRLCALVKQLKK